MSDSDPQMAVPRIGETWRAKSGRTREVLSVYNEDDLVDDGLWCLVHYRRPAPAEEELAAVTLKQWRQWVEKEQATCTQKTWRAA